MHNRTGIVKRWEEPSSIPSHLQVQTIAPLDQTQWEKKEAGRAYYTFGTRLVWSVLFVSDGAGEDVRNKIVIERESSITVTLIFIYFTQVQT